MAVGSHKHLLKLCQCVGGIRHFSFWAMKRDQAGFGMNGIQDSRDVTETSQHFRVALDERVIEVRKNPCRPIPATQCHNSVNLIVGKHLVDVVGAVLVSAREIAETVVEMLTWL